MEEVTSSIQNMSLSNSVNNKNQIKKELINSILNNDFDSFVNNVDKIVKNQFDINDEYLHQICKNFDEEPEIKKEMVKFLLLNGADINKKDKMGCSAFSFVCYYYFHNEMNFEFFKWFCNIENINLSSIDCDNLYPIDYLFTDDNNADAINYLKLKIDNFIINTII